MTAGGIANTEDEQVLENLNPFVTKGAKAPSVATTEIAKQRELAQVFAAMEVARRFPRDPAKAMDQILNAFSRPSLAEKAMYAYARGGSDIEGPSIRAAEAIARLWGNIDFGVREIEQRGAESTVESYAWDLETNLRVSKVFQIKHIRFTRSGTKTLDDPRDIYELVANNGARRLRACILAAIDGDVVEAAMKQAERTLKSTVTINAETLKSTVDAFAELGVPVKALEAFIQRRWSLETVTPQQVVRLRKIFASLKDGMSSPADWFLLDDAPAPADTSRTTAVKEQLARRNGGTKPAEEPAAAGASATAADPNHAPSDPDAKPPAEAAFASDDPITSDTPSKIRGDVDLQSAQRLVDMARDRGLSETSLVAFLTERTKKSLLSKRTFDAAYAAVRALPLKGGTAQ